MDLVQADGISLHWYDGRLRHGKVKGLLLYCTFLCSISGLLCSSGERFAMILLKGSIGTKGLNGLLLLQFPILFRKLQIAVRAEESCIFRWAGKSRQGQRE